MVPKEILVLGDSHVNVFTHNLFRVAFPNYYFTVVSVIGATISGLSNPNSTTQALPIFMRSAGASKAGTVIVMLGEVDVGFVIWYWADHRGITIDSVIEKAVRNYSQLLQDLSNKFKVICLSTPLPTIQDDNNWGEVANFRKEVKATQIQRTQLTLDFNQRVWEYCKQNNISYILLDPDSLGTDGLVRKDLINTNPNDHHYDIENYAKMLIEPLKVLL